MKKIGLILLASCFLSFDCISDFNSTVNAAYTKFNLKISQCNASIDQYDLMYDYCVLGAILVRSLEVDIAIKDYENCEDGQG